MIGDAELATGDFSSFAKISWKVFSQNWLMSVRNTSDVPTESKKVKKSSELFPSINQITRSTTGVSAAPKKEVPIYVNFTLAGVWKFLAIKKTLRSLFICLIYRFFNLQEKALPPFLLSATFLHPRPCPLFFFPKKFSPLSIIPAPVCYKFWPVPIVYTCPPVGISIRPFCDCANKIRISFPNIGVIDFGCPVQELVWSLQHLKGITSSQVPVLMKWNCVNFN